MCFYEHSYAQFKSEKTVKLQPYGCIKTECLKKLSRYRAQILN